MHIVSKVIETTANLTTFSVDSNSTKHFHCQHTVVSLVHIVKTFYINNSLILFNTFNIAHECGSSDSHCDGFGLFGLVYSTDGRFLITTTARVLLERNAALAKNIMVTIRTPPIRL